MAAAAGMGLLTSAAAAAELHGQPIESPATLLAMLMVCTSAGLSPQHAGFDLLKPFAPGLGSASSRVKGDFVLDIQWRDFNFVSSHSLRAWR